MRHSTQPTMPRACTAADFATLCGVSPRSVQRWLTAGMPARRHGRGRAVEIAPQAALRWILAQRGTPTSEHDRLAGLRADSVALGNARLRSGLIHADMARRCLEHLDGTLEELQALPDGLAEEIAALKDPALIRARLMEFTRGIRSNFADAIDRLADMPEPPWL